MWKGLIKNCTRKPLLNPDIRDLVRDQIAQGQPCATSSVILQWRLGPSLGCEVLIVFTLCQPIMFSLIEGYDKEVKSLSLSTIVLVWALVVIVVYSMHVHQTCVYMYSLYNLCECSLTSSLGSIQLFFVTLKKLESLVQLYVKCTHVQQCTQN